MEIEYNYVRRASGEGKYPSLYSKETGFGLSGVFADGLDESDGLNDGVTGTNGVTTYSTVTGFIDGTLEGTDPYLTSTVYPCIVENYINLNLGINTAPKQLLITNTDYWLASRCVGISSGNINQFSIRVFYNDGQISDAPLADERGEDLKFGIGPSIRPVVVLDCSVSLTVDYNKTTISKTYWDVNY